MMSNDKSFKMELRNRVGGVVEDLENEGYKREGFALSFKDGNKDQPKWKPKSHFAKIYNNELVNVIKNYNLDSYELSAILLLLPYVEYETNLIADGGVALNKKSIVKVLDFSENKTDNVLNSLVSKKILARTKVGRNVIFHMNPHLTFRGVWLSPETESIFRNL